MVHSYVDHIDANRLSGWAVTSDGLPTKIEVRVDGEHFLTVSTIRPRPDLKRAGLSAGLGGFDLVLKGQLSAGPRLVEVFSDGIAVPNGQRTIVVEPHDPQYRELNKYHAARAAALRNKSSSLKILGDANFAANLSGGSALSKMISYAGWKLTDASNADATIVFDVECNIQQPGAINGSGFSSDKADLSHAHRSAFLRDIEIDPRTFAGQMVVKARKNAAHNGRIVSGPFSIKGEIETAQRFIDTAYNGVIQDIRVPIFKGCGVPFVYLKYRPIEQRFGNINSSVVMTSAVEIFTQRELTQITNFAGLLKLDYGEIDILRDITSGEFYVVDANNTPVGPPNGLPDGEKAVAVRMLAASFADAFFS